MKKSELTDEGQLRLGEVMAGAWSSFERCSAWWKPVAKTGEAVEDMRWWFACLERFIERVRNDEDIEPAFRDWVIQHNRRDVYSPKDHNINQIQVWDTYNAAKRVAEAEAAEVGHEPGQ